MEHPVFPSQERPCKKQNKNLDLLDNFNSRKDVFCSMISLQELIVNGKDLIIIINKSKQCPQLKQETGKQVGSFTEPDFLPMLCTAE